VHSLWSEMTPFITDRLVGVLTTITRYQSTRAPVCLSVQATNNRVKSSFYTINIEFILHDDFYTANAPEVREGVLPESNFSVSAAGGVAKILYPYDLIYPYD